MKKPNLEQNLGHFVVNDTQNMNGWSIVFNVMPHFVLFVVFLDQSVVKTYGVGLDSIIGKK